MQKQLSRLIIVFLAAAVLPQIQSCKVAAVHVQVLKPADIFLPPNFQKFVLVDRTRPDKQHAALSTVEGIFTGEGLFQDRWGAQDCLEGLRRQLAATPRFTVTLASLDTTLKGTGRRMTMPPLDWKTVAKLVGNDTATGLIVLEAFDSDINILSELAQAASGNAAPVYKAHGDVNIYCVWRIYDLKSKTIVDEYTQNFSNRFDGSGASEEVARKNLPSRQNMVSNSGIAAGIAYANRISPQWIWVPRQYYRKGSPGIKQAAHMVKAGNWNAAADVLDKESRSSDKKVAARASFNMALASEVLGNLDLAIQWAQRAQQMGDNRASRYIMLLQQRQEEQQRLDEQMKSKQK